MLKDGYQYEALCFLGRCFRRRGVEFERVAVLEIGETAAHGDHVARRVAVGFDSADLVGRGVHQKRERRDIDLIPRAKPMIAPQTQRGVIADADFIAGPDIGQHARVPRRDDFKQAGRDASVRHWRVDGKHSNAFTAWQAMGSPQQPTAEQYQALEKAGRLAELQAQARVKVENGGARIRFVLPRQGVSLVTVTADQ